MPDWLTLTLVLLAAVLPVLTGIGGILFGRWTRRETVQLAQGMRVATPRPKGTISGPARTA